MQYCFTNLRESILQVIGRENGWKKKKKKCKDEGARLNLVPYGSDANLILQKKH